MRGIKRVIFLIAWTLFVGSCKVEQTEDSRLIVCSTSILADCVREIVGNQMEVVSLMHAGVDPHSYNPRPRDVEWLNKAHVVVYTGLHLEGKMADLFERLGQRKHVLSIQKGFPKDRLIRVDTHTFDPHVWFDVNGWLTALEKIKDELKNLYPDEADVFEQNFSAYRRRALDLTAEWKQMLDEVPAAQRYLITSHDAFHYFGRTFDIQIRALQGVSTVQEPSLRSLMNLSDFIVEHNIRAVFIENSVSPKVLYTVLHSVQNKGKEIVVGGTLYSDALGEEGSGAATYLDMLAYNVETIKKGLAYGKGN